tara:strand:- start:99 stop:941 length:843 start_codon:yes stop_codon:yes gene_type:complete
MSYHGTVTCSHCHTRGHNQRGCTKLKAEAAANPNSYAATKLNRLAPRTCSYCEGEGHNRRGCKTLKTHKQTFVSDTHLWRQAFAKWSVENGAAFGAILSAPINWQDHKGNYHEGNSKPCVGMLQTFDDSASGGLDHRQMQGGLRDWHVLGMEVIGGQINRNGQATMQGLMLPDIPVLAPANGKDHWGYERTRSDEQSQWTVVSRSPAKSGGKMASLGEAEARGAIWFQSGKDANTKNNFFEMTAPQRKAIKEFLNDSATLDELHARLNPADDTNSEAQTE